MPASERCRKPSEMCTAKNRSQATPCFIRTLCRKIQVIRWAARTVPKFSWSFWQGNTLGLRTAHPPGTRSADAAVSLAWRTHNFVESPTISPTSRIRTFPVDRVDYSTLGHFCKLLTTMGTAQRPKPGFLLSLQTERWLTEEWRPSGVWNRAGDCFRRD
jgi:hypothetical protein